MSRPTDLRPVGLPGVRRDADGVLWVRGSATDPAGRTREYGWRRATKQGAGRSVEALAYAELAQWQENVRTGRPDQAARDWTVAEWREEILSDDVAATTKRNQEAKSRVWLGVIGDMKLRAVGVPDIERAWQAAVTHGYSPGTLNIIRIYLRQPFREALRRGVIDFDPSAAADLPVPQKKRSRDVRRYAMSAEEIAPAVCRVRRWDESSQTYRGYAVCLLLMWSTGMRVGEALAMRPSWLQFDDDGDPELFIPPEVEKTSRGRVVVLSRWTHALLTEHIERRGHLGPNDRVFHFLWRAINERWKPALAVDGIPCGKPHGTSLGCFRHSARSYFEALGARRRLVNLMLGHGDQDVTDTYSQAVKGEMREAAETLADYQRRALLEAAEELSVRIDPPGYHAGTEEADVAESSTLAVGYDAAT